MHYIVYMLYSLYVCIHTVLLYILLKNQAVGLNLFGLFSKYFLNEFSCASEMFNIYM